MSKGRKRRYEEERAAKKWVLVYIDTYSFDEPAIVFDPMPSDKCLTHNFRPHSNILRACV